MAGFRSRLHHGGIEQEAIGNRRTAYITNGADGVISVNAAAVATGGPVYAEAIVNTALAQQSGAKSGDAFATILNDGAIDIGAFASVVGDAQAVAIINGAMYQSAIAGYETDFVILPPPGRAARSYHRQRRQRHAGQQRHHRHPRDGACS